MNGLIERSFADGCIVTSDIERDVGKEFKVLSSYRDPGDGKTWYLLEERSTLQRTARREDRLTILNVTYDHHPQK